MENKEQTILEIRKKVQDFQKYIAEYGFNSEQDIFIQEEIEELDKTLNNLEKNTHRHEK
jgi:NAD(P)H-flavin reductase|tara:strand:- start:56 stop:232 length:177 start_codon:yes stop_codon:yes gene_type:complete